MRLNSLFLLCTFLVVVSISVHVESKKSGIRVRFRGFPVNTRYRPVTRNIDTKNTTKCSAKTPLHLTGIVSAKTRLGNTGISIQTNNQRRNVANITGGSLGNGKYIYVSFTYYWASNDSTGVTGTTIDNQGFPYGVRVFYINQKYRSFPQALKHKDGFVDVIFLFTICKTRNSAFDPISKEIQKLAKAGKSITVSLGTQIQGVDSLNGATQYYTYVGKFRDFETGRTYKCSRVILFKPDDPRYCITKAQFVDTFGPLKNFKGDDLTNTLTHDGSELQTELCTGITRTVIP